MNNNDNEKDKVEKQLKKLKSIQQKSIIILSPFLHNNLLINLVLSFIINLIVIFGLTVFNIFLVEIDFNNILNSYLIFVGLFTLLDNYMRLILYKYYKKYVIKSIGLINQFFSIFIIIFIVEVFKDYFLFSSIDELTIFIIVFIIFRALFNNNYKKYMYKKSISKLINEVEKK